MKKITKFRHSVRAISPIIATLLLIAIAVVASLVAYAWIMGYIGSSTSKAGNALQIQSYTTSGNLVVYVQNTGQGLVHLKHDGSVYVNGNLENILLVDGQDASTGQLDPIPVDMGQTRALTIDFQPTPGEELNIKVVTVEGTTIQGSTTATSSQTPKTVTFTQVGGPASSISPSVGNHQFNLGSYIQLIATVGSGDAFANWGATGQITIMNDQSATTIAKISGIGTISGNFVAANSQRLSITSGASQTVLQNQLSKAITIQRHQDSAGSITVNLASSSTTGIFYSDSSGTTKITTIPIATQGGTAIVYYKDSAVVQASLTFSAQSYLSATSTFSITNPSPTPAPTPVLTSITISPATSSITAGASKAYTAQGLDQNGKSMGDYTLSTTFSASGATITGNSVSATKAGSYTVTGTCNGITSNSATLTVTAGSATTVTISPPTASITAGGSQAYTASAADQYGNSLGDVTSSSTFSASPTGGVVTQNSISETSVGSYTITASYQSVTSNQATLQVTPAQAATLAISPTTATYNAGGSQAYTATAHDQYGNPTDVTSSAVFSLSSNPISGNTVTTTTLGVYSVTATYSGLQSNPAQLTVTGGPITSITVSPATASIVAGGSQAFTATAFDQYGNQWDATNAVAWSINSGAGTYTWTANSVGVTAASASSTPWTVTATASNGVLGTAQLTVTAAPMTSITVNPPSASIVAGGSQSYTATAADQFGNTWDITGTATWSINSVANSFTWTGGSVTETQASVSGTPWTITATLNAISGTAQLTVTPSSIVTVEITPGSAMINAGGSKAFTATGADQYGNEWDITGTATWSINSAANSFTWTGGSVTETQASTPGTPWAVTATSNGVKGTAPLTVNPGQAASITITGYPTTINAGQLFGGVVVTAYDSYNNVAVGYTGQVYFTSTPSGATVPYTTTSKYTFTATDSGVHTFLGFVSPNGASSFTITVTDGTLPPATSNSITVLTTTGPNYQTSITPTSATSGQSASYTYTVTKNSGSSSTLGWVAITIPAGYTNTAITSVTASNGQGWTATLAGNVITAHANAASGVLSSTGNTVQIIFTATAPTTAGTYGPFTSTVYQTFTGTGGPGTLSGTDPTVTVLPAGTKLVFTGTAQSLPVGTVSASFTVQLEDANGAPINTGVTLTINLATSSTGGAFYSNADGADSHMITSITIPSGHSSSTSIWYRDLTAGSSTLTGSCNGYTSATIIYTITGNTEPQYSVSMNPAQVAVGHSATFTITVTRQSSFLDDISYVTITVPPSFAGVTISSVTCSNGGTWTGSYASGVITLQTSNSNADLEDGTTDSVTVIFTATPQTTGAYTFAIASYGHLAAGSESHNMGPGTNTGSNPSVTVYTAAISKFTVTAQGGGNIGTQTSGSGFTVSISALDQNNNPITSYGSSIPLYVSGGLTISPPSTGTSGWSNGVWTGTVTLTGVGTGISITANDGSGHTGTSNSFTVTTFGLDGETSFAKNQHGATLTLTTTQSNDVIIVQIADDYTGHTFTVTDAKGLTWQHRSNAPYLVNGELFDEWYAIAPSPLSSDTITVTETGQSSHDLVVTAFGISGAKTSAPFDTNSGLPHDRSGTGTPSVTGVNTSNANDIILGFVAYSGTSTIETAPSGYTMIASQVVSGNYLNGAAMYSTNPTTSILSGATISFGTNLGNSVTSIMLVDAIVRGP